MTWRFSTFLRRWATVRRERWKEFLFLDQTTICQACQLFSQYSEPRSHSLPEKNYFVNLKSNLALLFNKGHNLLTIAFPQKFFKFNEFPLKKLKQNYATADSTKVKAAQQQMTFLEVTAFIAALASLGLQVEQ